MTLAKEFNNQKGDIKLTTIVLIYNRYRKLITTQYQMLSNNKNDTLNMLLN